VRRRATQAWRKLRRQEIRDGLPIGERHDVGEIAKMSEIVVAVHVEAVVEDGHATLGSLGDVSLTELCSERRRV